MKLPFGFSFCCSGIIIVLALVVFFTGCTQPSQGPMVTPSATTGQVSPGAVPSLVPTTLPYGITISVPGDWERQDVLTTGIRDYGQETINIANFFSPDEIPGDPQSYNSLSIDIDQNPQGTFDQYFNNATIAVGNTYSNPINIQAHSYALKISGFDSYELDFQSSDVKGTYIFTNAKGSIYIFAFKGPNKPAAVNALNSEIVDMYKSIQLNPSPATIVKQR